MVETPRILLRCMSPEVADIVAKVENRTTPKISRKSTFGLHCCCSGFQCHYRGPWSILDETIWSLTSPCVKRASGSRNFPSTPQKDFCNNIGTERTCRSGRDMSAIGARADVICSERVFRLLTHSGHP